jgi:hypothetical protein
MEPNLESFKSIPGDEKFALKEFGRLFGLNNQDQIERNYLRIMREAFGSGDPNDKDIIARMFSVISNKHQTKRSSRHARKVTSKARCYIHDVSYTDGHADQ